MAMIVGKEREKGGEMPMIASKGKEGMSYERNWNFGIQSFDKNKEPMPYI